MNLIGGYELQQEIGRGDLATVYVARQRPVERYVALKLFDRVTADAAQRLRQLGDYLGVLDHTNILPVYATGLSGDQVFWVMRYLPAGTLQDRLRVHAFSPEEIDRLVAQVAGALDYAHGHNIFHGDLKPANILLDHAGNAFVADFGVVQAVGVTASDYQAPELKRNAEPDARSDVYSLGAIVYELLTDRRPSDVITAEPARTNRRVTPPPRPSLANPKVPAAIDAVVLKALAIDPAERYATPAEFVAALAQARVQAAEAAAAVVNVRRIPARREAAPAPAARRRWPWIVAGLIGLVVVIGAIGLLPPPPAATPTPIATLAPTVTIESVVPIAAPSSTLGSAPTATTTSAPTPTDRPTVTPALTPVPPTLTATASPTAAATRLFATATPTVTIGSWRLLTPRFADETTLRLTFNTTVLPADLGPVGTLAMSVPDVEAYVIDRELAQAGSGDQTLQVGVRIRCPGVPEFLSSRSVLLTLTAADGRVLLTQSVAYLKRWCD